MEKAPIKMWDATLFYGRLIGRVKKHPKLQIASGGSVITTSKILETKENDIFEIRNNSYQVVSWAVKKSSD